MGTGLVKIVLMVLAVGMLQLFLMELTSKNGGLLNAVKRELK